MPSAGSSEWLTWAALLTCLRSFGGKAFTGRGTGSETLALLLLSPSFELLLVPVHRPASAPTPGQRLPAGSGKDSTTKLALVNLKFKINLTERAAAQAPLAILAKQQHLAEATSFLVLFFFWGGGGRQNHNPKPHKPRSQAKTSSPPKPGCVGAGAGKGRGSVGPGVNHRLAAFFSWQAAPC